MKVLEQIGSVKKTFNILQLLDKKTIILGIKNDFYIKFIKDLSNDNLNLQPNLIIFKIGKSKTTINEAPLIDCLRDELNYQSSMNLGYKNGIITNNWHYLTFRIQHDVNTNAILIQIPGISYWDNDLEYVRTLTRFVIEQILLYCKNKQFTFEIVDLVDPEQIKNIIDYAKAFQLTASWKENKNLLISYDSQETYNPDIGFFYDFLIKHNF